MHGINPQYGARRFGEGQTIKQFVDADEFDFDVDFSDETFDILRISWWGQINSDDSIQLRLNGIDSGEDYQYTNIITGEENDTANEWKLMATDNSDFAVVSGVCNVIVRNPRIFDDLRPSFWSGGSGPNVGRDTMYTGEYDAGIEPTSAQLFIDSPGSVGSRARVRFSAVRL